MKKLNLVLIGFILVLSTNAQDRYFTRSGKVHFFSKAALENIEALNTKGTSVIDFKTGQMEFAVLMKAFEFEKELMMEHFNENYVESDKYPKTTFKGTVTNIASVDLNKDGIYPVQIKGELTLHGVTKETSAEGTMEVKAGKFIGKSNFVIILADYKIDIPSVVKDKISKTIKIDVTAAYEKMSM